MHIKEIISIQKEKVKESLKSQELALGEIIFNNGQCQILAQSGSCFELIVIDELKNEIAEYSLNVDDNGNIFPKNKKEETE